jgi:hypothetical protein
MYHKSVGLFYCPMLWKLTLAPSGAPTSTTTRETASRERGNYGREMTGNFADNGDFHASVGIFYMLQICDMGPTTLLPLRRKACWGFFRPGKSDGSDRVRTRERGYQRPAAITAVTPTCQEPNTTSPSYWWYQATHGGLVISFCEVFIQLFWQDKCVNCLQFWAGSHIDVVHSFISLSHDRSKTSSKASSPHSAI